jgi:muramoyltetrapeptide carboxypeptidase
MMNPLQPGDCIALVAPSSPFEIEKYSRASSILVELGYRVAPGKNVLRREGYLAGTDVERVEDLVRAIVDPSITAVICIRGGFGSSRLLHHLPFSTLKQNHKIFLGYSDTTCLHLAFWTRNRWTTFHGPNLIDMVDSPDHLDGVLSALSGSRAFSWSLDDQQILRPGVASGPMLGGNLSCLCHLLGTNYCPDFRGALLLVEDRGEALYRLDRLVTQLQLAGVLDQIAGLILGQFHECEEHHRIRDMVFDHVRYHSFPVIADLPFGHGSANQVIPLGAQFLLNTYEKSLKILCQPFASTDTESV